jgi:XTP/dITP diphosphohydrolase
MITLIFATNNSHKVQEIKKVVGNKFNVISLQEAGIDKDIPEPHNTLEKNALEKSSTIYQLTNTNCFSEDTGLEVAALNGAPGVHSARYAGEGRSFSENIKKLLYELKDCDNRSAQFRTVVSLIVDGKEYQFTGICKGAIIDKPIGTGGFGYDAVFVPDGDTRSFAQMPLDEKNIFSHRRKAIDQLIQFLSNFGNKFS